MIEANCSEVAKVRTGRYLRSVDIQGDPWHSGFNAGTCRRLS